MTNNKHIQTLVKLVLGLLSIFLIFLSLYFAKLVLFGKEPDTVSASISVSATGEAKVVPTIATFSFAAVETGKDVAEAQSKMADVANKAIAFVKSKGIDEKDIQTTGYNANPKYDYTPTKQVLTGYEARETITIKIRDQNTAKTKAGEILSGVGQLGVSEISNLSFESEDKDVLKQQATEDAVVKAKAKAEALAKAAGFRLVRVIGFDESQSPTGPVPYGIVAMDKAVSSAPIIPEIQPGENTMSSTVTITYEIR